MATDDLIKQLAAMIGESKAENIALRAVCSVLISEIAFQSGDPEATVMRVTSGLMGAAENLAQIAGSSSEAVSNVIENISTMAEGIVEAAL